MRLRLTGKSKFKYKKWVFKLPVFGYNIHVVVTDDLRQALDKFGFKDFDDTGTMAVHFIVKDESRSWIFLPLDAGINEITHECTHAVQRIIDWIGAGYKEREFVAYLMAHVVQGVWEFHEHCKKVLDK